jgi:hypothetical protein
MSTVATVSPQLVVRESEYLLKNQPTVLKTGIPDYSSKFKGGASGTTVKIAKPTKVGITTGAWDTSSSAQAVRDGSVDLTMGTTPINVTFNFTPDQLGMNFEDMSAQFIKPGMARLVAAVEKSFLDSVVAQISNVHNAASLTSAAVASLRTMLGDSLCPQDNLKAVVRYQMNQDLQQDTEDLFNAAASISKSNLKGAVPSWGGFEFSECTIMPVQTTGTRTNTGGGTVGTTNTEGANTVILDVGAGTNTIKKGETFYSVGEAVNDQTKASLGTYKKWTVAADATATDGLVTVTLTENVYASTSDPRQNTTKLLTSGDAIVWIGGTSASIMQGLFYDPMAFATAFLDLPAYDESNAAPFTVPGTKIRGLFKRQENVATGVTTYRWDVVPAWALVENAFAARFLRTATTTP